MFTKICAYCGDEFGTCRAIAQFCSVKCSNKSRIGNDAWNKGLTGKEFKAHYKNGFKGIYKKGCIPPNPIKKGEHRGLEYEFKKGHITWSIGLKGENHPNWKGGLTLVDKQIRHSFEYRQWRDDIFTRDDFTCQECGKTSGNKNAHHIISFSSILQKYEITNIEEALDCNELWNINNGITLCEKCHRKIHRRKVTRSKEDNVLEMLGGVLV